MEYQLLGECEENLIFFGIFGGLNFSVLLSHGGVFTYGVLTAWDTPVFFCPIYLVHYGTPTVPFFKNRVQIETQEHEGDLTDVGENSSESTGKRHPTKQISRQTTRREQRKERPHKATEFGSLVDARLRRFVCDVLSLRVGGLRRQIKHRSRTRSLGFPKAALARLIIRSPQSAPRCAPSAPLATLLAHTTTFDAFVSLFFLPLFEASRRREGFSFIFFFLFFFSFLATHLAVD